MMDDFVNWIMIDVFAMSSDSLIFIGAAQALTGSDEAVVIVNHCLTETGGVRTGSSLVEFQSVKINDLSNDLTFRLSMRQSDALDESLLSIKHSSTVRIP